MYLVLCTILRGKNVQIFNVKSRNPKIMVYNIEASIIFKQIKFLLKLYYNNIFDIFKIGNKSVYTCLCIQCDNAFNDYIFIYNLLLFKLC